MGISYATPSEDDLEEINELDSTAFGYVATEKHVEASKELLELDRFVVANDGDAIVGCGGNFSLELTLPGANPMPMAGVTWVAVAASHRRLGIGGQIMARLDEDARAHGDALIGLTASEGGIYERFGYGPATMSRNVNIDRRRVQLAPGFKPSSSSVRLVDRGASLDEFEERFDRFRRRRVGEISRPRALLEHNLEPDESIRQVAALHDDGYAVWTITADWGDGDPQHQIRLWDLVAVTEDAYLALWDLLLSTDLVGQISSRWAAPDERLPYFLDNPRALKTSQVGDHLWLKVLDPVAAFGARDYRTTDRFILEVADGSQLSVENASASTVEGKKADIKLTESAVGPLLLGGVAPSTLAAGHRLSASSEVLGRADAFFGVSPVPHCGTAF